MIGGFFKVSDTIETVVLSTKEYNELLDKVNQYNKELNELKQMVLELDEQRRTKDS